MLPPLSSRLPPPDFRLALLVGFALALASSLSAKPDSLAQNGVASSYADLYGALADADTVTDGHEARTRRRVMTLVRSCVDERGEYACSDHVFRALEIAGRLRSRARLLDAVADFGFGLDLSRGSDSARASLTFALGLVDHARGDLTAARMWFDSTLALRGRGLRHHVISAAAKLNGYILWEDGAHAAAADHFATAKALVSEYDGPRADLYDASSAWAATSALAGGSVAEALPVSRAAYTAVREDRDLLDRETYAYLVYLNHATVLEVAGESTHAEQVLREGIALCARRGDGPARAYVELRLAGTLLRGGRTEEARELLEATVPVFAETQRRNHLAEAHAHLEAIYAARDGGAAQALHHARAARDLRYALLEDSRLESLVALQRDYRSTQAEHRATLAEAAAARAELERSRAASQQTASWLAIACVLNLLAFVVRQLRQRRRYGRTLKAEVVERTAQLRAKTRELEAKTAELEVKTARLEASNEELERFAYIASHDLKTPLRNVTSFLGLIERRMPEAARPAIGEYVELARGYARSMHHLVTDVLEFSRLNADVDELSAVTDVRALCTEVVAQRAAAIAAAGAQVAVLGRAELYVPRAFLSQMVGNLVDNGLKYNRSPAPRVTIELIGGEREVRIRVRDNGIGIAPAYHERVFQLFKRLHTHDEYAGTGLGLSTCRKVARRLGGDISLESAEGEGSVFEVRLPKRAAGTHATDAAADHATANGPSAAVLA